MPSALTTLDAAIVFVYLAALAGVGVYFSRREQSTDTFLVAARRMTWLPVGLSLMAALNSGVDYLTQPSATIQYGLVLLVGTLSWLAIYPWVARVVFPFYHRLHFYSVYEYLEARFDVRVRTLAAFIFILWRLGWMATALYVPCLAIHAVTGGAIDLTTMIVTLGVIVTMYTMLGGIQAVIWNDLVQFFVMFGGLAATVLIVTASVPGGVPQIWELAETTGRTALWVPVDNVFTQPMTVPALLFALIVGRMAQYTSDQVMVQRLQTTRTVTDARQAFVVNAAGDALWMVGLSAVGLALFGYFQFQPAPVGLSSDRMLPYFMASEFPAGAVGLVIAAILAASLSSIDSAIHACSSVLVVDVYDRLLVTSKGGAARSVKVLRVATVLVGAAGTTLACNVASIGSLIEIANKMINSFSGPLFGIFIVAMFSHRATSVGALVGGCAGALTAYVVAYHSPIGFLWPSTFGFAVTVTAASVASAIAPSSKGAEWTWRAVMARQSSDASLADAARATTT
jgi:SSS family solute:Na+ symporter